ncbi:MAG: type II toxin-antitoxin system VapC family toxin [Nitrospirae bacterium]|nr:type II toxin-antitoxin system VapC family toxin [Nitrospirota bacterium]
MKKYIIDTDLYIELLRTGQYHDIIAEIYARETPNIYFSSVVAQELLSGVISEDGRKNVETILRPFERVGRVVTPGHTIWKETGEILSMLRRQKPNLKTKLSQMINDALIAMSARSIGATVISLNSSDFEAIKSVRNFSYITVA